MMERNLNSFVNLFFYERPIDTFNSLLKELENAKKALDMAQKKYSLIKQTIKKIPGLENPELDDSISHMIKNRLKEPKKQLKSHLLNYSELHSRAQAMAKEYQFDLEQNQSSKMNALGFGSFDS